MPRSGSAAVQSAFPFLHLPPLLAELGVDLDDVLAGTGLRADAIRPGGYIGYDQALQLIKRAATLSGRDDLGVQLGKRQGIASLGPIGDVMRHAATLGEALGDCVSLHITDSTGAAIYLHCAGNDYAFGYAVYQSRQSSAYLHDLVLAAGCNIVHELTQGGVQPTELHSERARPANLLPYLELARCPLRFGQSQTCLFVSAASMAFKLPRADPIAHQETLARLMPLITSAPWGTAGRVRHALRPLLLIGKGHMADIAEQLHMHPRSLRRALEREETTFDELKNEVRYSMARELLGLGSLSVGDIAMSLDYATPSAFIHAFTRWSGTSPERWRNRLSR